VNRQRVRRARPDTRPAPSAGPNRQQRRVMTVNRGAKHSFVVTFPRSGTSVLVHSTATFPWVRKATNRRRNRIAAASRRANRGSR
jgi:hypothetical protein